MALYQFLCGSTLVIILLFNGCHSQQPVCGRAVKNTKIVGGQSASPGSWPWLVSLTIGGRSFCAGSLISDRWVLTAAHCLRRDMINKTTIVMGRNSLSGPNLHEESRGIDDIIRHPLYIPLVTGHDNDISLLKLSAPVNFSDYIQPVCVAAYNSTFHSGVSSWVSGFGVHQLDTLFSPNVLQEVSIPVVGNNECLCTHVKLTENMMCAGLRAGGKDSCQGDSGAPLVTKKDGVWLQSGIVSSGQACGDPRSPGVYTRVSRYQEWISVFTGNNHPGFVAYISSGVDSDLGFNCSELTVTKTQTAQPPVDFPTPNAVFNSGENAVHFSHFAALCLLLVSLHVLVGDQ